MTVANVQSRVAGLAESEQVISGVAVGVGDVTRGLSGDQKVWTAEELREAAESLEGTPVNPLHSQADVGEVVRAGFDPDRGVVYEAELEDPDLAEQVADGGLEVSIEARHADGGTVETDRGEAMRASDIQFTGMALVQHGAAPSASASPGEAAALSPADIHAALEEDDPASTEGDASDIEISDEVEEGLQNKVDEHNEEAPESKQVTLGMLKKVFRRGAGAWLNSNAGATQQQWAYARVNAFLEDLMADRPLNSGNDNDLAPDGYDVAENAHLVDVNGTEVDIEPPERVINAVEAGMEAKEEYADAIGDCGTGVGEAMSEVIVGGDLTPEILRTGGDIASNSPATYLASHADDVGAEGAPTTWTEDDWTGGCGEVQQALWGFYEEWFTAVKEEIEAAMEDSEMAYHQDEEADMAEVPDEYIYDNPGEAVAKAEEMGVGDDRDLAGDEMIHTHGGGEDTVFMPGPSHDALMEMLEEMGELAAADLKGVGPVEFDDVGEGELDESEIPTDDYEGHYINAGENKSDSSFPVVDADGTLRRGNVEAAWDLRGQGDLGMPRDAAERVMRSLGREFGDPGSEANPIPEEAYESESAAADTDDPEPGEVAGGEPEQRTDEQTGRFNPHMSETEEELRARLSEKDDRIAELESQVEQYEAEREDVARAYAEALAADDSVFDADDLVSKFEVAELREKFEAAEDATLADTEPDVQSGAGDGGPETATLSDEQQAEVAEHREVIADLADSDSVIATKEREHRADLVAEITGEDPDTILEEA